jgi:ABC-type dipeptide/oligopeptide/nickel transport system permease component
MLRYLSLRVLYMLPVVWLVVSLVFLLIHLVPGDPILQMLGEGAPVTDVQAARHAYGLDLPLGRQYLNYWEGVLRGDLGPSLRFNQGVTRLIAQRYPYTLQLTLAALVVAILLSVPAGVRSAQRRNRWDDRLLSVVSLFGLSFPNFALGPILILLFSIQLGWLPVSGSGTLAHLVLPAITMGGALAAILTRMVRTSMLEELGQDYIRTARAKGLTEPGDHGPWPAVRSFAGRRHRDRDYFFGARNRTPDHPGYFQPRLLSGAGLHTGDWIDIRGGEFFDRLALFGG